MLKKILITQSIEKSKQKVHCRRRNGKIFTAGSYVKHDEVLEDLKRAISYLQHIEKKKPENTVQKKDLDSAVNTTKNRIKNLREMLKDAKEK